MVKYIFVSLILGITCIQAQGQFIDRYIRLGISAGAMGYMGDLGNSFPTGRYNLGFGGYASYRLSPMFALRGSVLRGKISAFDSDSDALLKQARNLSFRSDITEFSVQGVFDFFFTSRSYVYRPRATPYVFTGVSVFSFKPQAPIRGTWLDLQPLGTEGQYLKDPGVEYPDPYKLVQIAVPMGMGIRIELADEADLEIECGLRKTFTDYLDDVSGYYPNLRKLKKQDPVAFELSDRSLPVIIEGRDSEPRGQPAQKDWYVYTVVSFSFIIDWVRCPK